MNPTKKNKLEWLYKALVRAYYHDSIDCVIFTCLHFDGEFAVAWYQRVTLNLMNNTKDRFLYISHFDALTDDAPLTDECNDLRIMWLEMLKTLVINNEA